MMKKVIMMIYILGVATLSFAQRGGQRQGPPSPEEMIKKATKELSLTDDQVKEWEAIHEKYEDAMKDRSKAQETRKAMGQELEATLTEDQLEKFKKMRQNQRPPRQN